MAEAPHSKSKKDLSDVFDDDEFQLEELETSQPDKTTEAVIPILQCEDEAELSLEDDDFIVLDLPSSSPKTSAISPLSSHTEETLPAKKAPAKDDFWSDDLSGEEDSQPRNTKFRRTPIELPPPSASPTSSNSAPIETQNKTIATFEAPEQSESFERVGKEKLKIEKIASIVVFSILSLAVLGAFLLYKNIAPNDNVVLPDSAPLQGKHIYLSSFHTQWVNSNHALYPSSKNHDLYPLVTLEISDTCPDGKMRLSFINTEGSSIGDLVTLQIENGVIKRTQSRQFSYVLPNGIQDSELAEMKVGNSALWTIMLREASLEARKAQEFVPILKTPILHN